jgi:biotin synthase
MTPAECLKTLAMFRFTNPTRDIRIAGGREVNLRSMQALALYPANSLFVDGYLTTPGAGAEHDLQMIRDAGFEVAEIVVSPPSHAERARGGVSSLAHEQAPS